MAVNEASAYGRDIRCFYDADPFFTSVEGVETPRQHAFHRLTTDNILGDDGTGSLVIKGWGFDVRRLAGVPTADLTLYQPVLHEVLLRDERIETVDVRIEVVASANGVDDVTIDVQATTALGPFDLVLSVNELANLIRGEAA